MTDHQEPCKKVVEVSEKVIRLDERTNRMDSRIVDIVKDNKETRDTVNSIVNSLGKLETRLITIGALAIFVGNVITILLAPTISKLFSSTICFILPNVFAF